VNNAGRFEVVAKVNSGLEQQRLNIEDRSDTI